MGNKKRIKVKQDYLLMESACISVIIKTGVYDYQQMKEEVERTLLKLNYPFLSSFEGIINNDLLNFEVINPEWRPDPFHKNTLLAYHAQIKLTQREKALRKLKQIADFLNGDKKPRWEGGHDDNFELVFNYNNNSWRLVSAGANRSAAIYFSSRENDTLEAIKLYMDNGDGVYMSHLLVE